MSEKELVEECSKYFQERAVYKKLFPLVRNKYYSLGHLGGSVTLTNLSVEEKEQLSGFFQKDFRENKTVTISVALMEKALQSSRFAELEWVSILEHYFGRPLATKEDDVLQAEKEKSHFFRSILEEFPGSVGADWLKRCLQNKQEGYQQILQQYREKPLELHEILQNLLRAIPQLPIFTKERKVAIPVFAAKISGNPHFFDRGTLAEKLLLAFLKDCENISPATEGNSLEKINRLFFEAGLLRDDLSNCTLTYGILGYDMQGRKHEGMQGFLQKKEPLQLTLLSISKLSKVCAVGQNRIYIVENPAVFSALAEAVPDIALICGNGQLRMATLLLLDLFSENVEFWYAGDFDPEGLMIAQRLRKRYGARLRFWNYKKCYYEKYLSKVKLDEIRIRKLAQIEESELMEIRDLIAEHGYATYQERLIPEYLADLL